MSEQQQTLTIQQALDLAVQHHTAGRLVQAENIYQQILQKDPNQPVALHLLGVIAHQEGRNDTAVDLITKAIDLKPDLAEAHSNLGLALRELGKLEESVASYRRALAIKPDLPEVYKNLGDTLRDLERLDEAITNYKKAIRISPDLAEVHNNLGLIFKDFDKLDDALVSYDNALTINPNYAEAHYNLGNALTDLGKLDGAVASFQKVLDLEPNSAATHYNLGNVLKDLGKLEEAVASYCKAIAIKPDHSEAHNNVGNALKDLGKLEEAVASYQKALHIKPDYVQAHSNLGHALQELGLDRFVEAKEAFDQGFHISHGGAWWNAATFTDDDDTGNMMVSEPMYTSTFQLIDTIDQLEYLITKGRIDRSFERLADRYRAVLAEIQLAEKPVAVTKLSPDQLKRLGSSYNRVIHYAEAPRIDTCAVNETLDFRQIEDRYLSSPVSVTTLDDFLMPEALHALRDFCLESTIFFTHAENHFVSSKLSNGFTCDLLYQVAEELKERFPRVLGNHHLANMWIYRYNNQSKGVVAHTDEGAVTFNFWITPDDANRIPDRGGLIVYAKEQPYDWDWLRYNRQKYVPAVSREIADFLIDADTVTIPYRENRAALFHSNLFHKSDEIHFKDGFENRRMNITLLFGKRKS